MGLVIGRIIGSLIMISGINSMMFAVIYSNEHTGDISVGQGMLITNLIIFGPVLMLFGGWAMDRAGKS